MRKILIDLGAHIGESVEFFRKHHPQGHEFEIYCFEPLPENIEKLKEIDNITIIPKAASTENGMAKFYIGQSESGSLCREKRTGLLDGKKHIKVEKIDFPKWFEQFIHPSVPYIPEIWIKMNIEGAEYWIIEDMHLCGQTQFVHKWYINWHWDKVGMKKIIHDSIAGMVPSYHPWLAMFGGEGKWFKDTL